MPGKLSSRVWRLAAAAIAVSMALMLPELAYQAVLMSVDGRPTLADGVKPSPMGEMAWRSSVRDRLVEKHPVGFLKLWTTSGSRPTLSRCADESAARAAMRFAEVVAQQWLREADAPESGWTRMAVAVWMTRNWTAAEILSQWEQVVTIGPRYRGMNSAAQSLFGVPGAALSGEQQALLVGTATAARTYDPACRPEEAVRNRDEVIDGLRTCGQPVGMVLSKSGAVKFSASACDRETP